MAAVTLAEEPVRFSQDVRSILSNRCFKCHGFDPETREAGLRLDTFDGLFGDENGYHAFVPGDVDNSAALERVFSDDPDMQMPPPHAKMEMTESEKEILKKWVEQGAKWEPHWSFESPIKAAVPELKDDNWSINVIDRFVLEKMQEVGLTPSPDADRETLIRRVSLDLTGLPPSRQEIEDFVQDQSPDAYERLVDRLLSQPAYGERWARRWLDLARYADTNGYEKDRTRTIWPYRDWVVNALNKNLPFDDFTVQQLAGDLIPDADEQSRIATGFHRNTMLNEEGGIDPLEFRFHAMTDRVATTGTTWLGLTTGCAQCHDHKYDPISHVEYFGLMAFLNNADEVELPIHQDDLSNRLESQKATQLKIEQLLKELPSHWPKGEGSEAGETSEQLAENAFSAWLERERVRAATWVSLNPTKLSTNLPLMTVEDESVIFVTGDITKRDQYLLQAPVHAKLVTGIMLEALPDERLPASGPGMTYYEGNHGDFFLTEIVVRNQGAVVPFGSASESYWKNQFGANQASAASAIDGDQQTGWSIDGRQGERSIAVFQFAQPVDLEEIELELNFGRHFAASLGKFRISYTTDQSPIALDLSEEAEVLLRKTELTPADRETLKRAFLLQSPELAQQVAEVRKLLAPVRPLTSLVFRERPVENPRATYLYHRGEFMQPRQELPPVTLAVLNPFPEDAPLNRLGLAEWLVSRDNPLTARVVVNRHWAALFGRGLVATLDDFGFQGDAPTHPELLDWLAVEFMDSGWDLKAMLRLIVTSRTYQQSSVITAESLLKDPSNHFLSRTPRIRLEAEIIRDAGLTASGLLSRKIGGPPVYPLQPEGVTESAYGSPEWPVSQGEDRYRRSLYTFSKRTAPFAMFATFDAPSGEACIARRDVSNTALQGLTILNDEMFMEIARGLSQHVVEVSGDSQERVNDLFLRVLSRHPQPEESRAILDFVASQTKRFEDAPEDTAKMTAELADRSASSAAWVAACRAVLGLDEALTRN